MFGTGWDNGSVFSRPQPQQQAPAVIPKARPGATTPPGGGGMTTPPPPQRPPRQTGGGKPGQNPFMPAPPPGGAGFLNMFNKPLPAPGGAPGGPPPGVQTPPPTLGLPQPPPAPSGPVPSYDPIPGQKAGVRVHHNMYAGNNRGEVRTNPTTGKQEILMGGGGGETYVWMPYNPSDYGQRQNAEMFARYGPGWTSGSGATSMHSNDIAQVLREQLGREPTQNEIYDVYYGVNRGVAGIAYNP